MTTVAFGPHADVNDAFASERARQLEAVERRQADLKTRLDAGTLIPLGDGRYRVNDPGSWDNGEIWIQQDSGLVVPQHGLDMSTGRAALYTAKPAWHQLGTVIEGGTTDIDTVLKAGAIDFAVETFPVLFRTPDGQLHELDDQRVTVRRDTDAGLGVVGNRYEVVQNRDIFGFLQALVGRDDVIWETAGALRGGRRVFVTMRLPDTIVIDPAGIADVVAPFLAAFNSHDGLTGYESVVTPWRVLCGNTERFAARDAVARWSTPHVGDPLARLRQAEQTLRMTRRYYASFAAEQELLLATELAIDEYLAVVADVWAPPGDDDADKAKAKYRRFADGMVHRFEQNADKLGRNAYAAERAITEFMDWGRGVRAPKSMTETAWRASQALEGDQDGRKNTAHKRLLTLVRR
ncbi:DUF932 domain-containing protein [Catellatospora bangladeshensis]|uniref:DUF932 domain-containing protein n=1 Tax=Catellatospora bangladeshensis TaxID=310355 RepID=A0A8J3JNP0_9ACTN|nr:DUF932 domain-containing protein [Catellatospora bangladeshensis]GIF82053.1 hypothetical protein Cba03nite_34020 [Catellatospora bangladeshensis]